MINVDGIAPDALIRSTESDISVKSVGNAIKEAEQNMLKTSFGEYVLKPSNERERTQPILINLSGGQKVVMISSEKIGLTLLLIYVNRKKIFCL